MVDKPGFGAVIIPGFISGFLIWTVVLASDSYISAAGHVELRSTVFSLVVLLFVPLFLITGGILSEIIWNRVGHSGWTPLVSYLAGFLGCSTAVVLTAITASVNQYVPYLDPGMIPRLSFVPGSVIVALLNPVSLSIIAIFSLFSLAGGYIMHIIRIRAEKR
jgi:hypothetical protein